MSAYEHFEKQMDPTPRMLKRSGPFTSEGLKSVAEALAFCEDNGLDPAEVKLAHNYVTWEREETPEEVEARISFAQNRAKEHVEWVARTHREYVERGLVE